jgi:hypothetical protein
MRILNLYLAQSEEQTSCTGLLAVHKNSEMAVRIYASKKHSDRLIHSSLYIKDLSTYKIKHSKHNLHTGSAYSIMYIH